MPRQRTRYWRVTYVFPEDFAQCLSPNPPKDGVGLAS